MHCEHEKTFNDLLGDLRRIAGQLTLANEWPERGVDVFETIGRGKNNMGMVISYKICANEPTYPATVEELKDENRTQSTFLTIKNPTAKKWLSFVEIQMDKYMAAKFPPPKDAEIIQKQMMQSDGLFDDNGESADDDVPLDDDEYKVRIMIPRSSTNLLTWVKEVIQYRISNYCSTADPFGCCSSFNECSDARKCTHPNRMYSTACAYRHNLEAGRIFYGKNKNI